MCVGSMETTCILSGMTKLINSTLVCGCDRKTIVNITRFSGLGSPEVVHIPSNVYKKSSSPHSQSKEDLYAELVSRTQEEPVGSFQYEAGITKETIGTTETTKTMDFVDPNTDSYTTEVVSDMDPTRYVTADPRTTLAGFFERPVQIATYDWQVGGGVDALFKPWALWAENARVSNRLSNYRNFKGKLHVKFLINGNQFYWGKAYASYIPYNVNTNFRFEDNDLSVIPALQRPHIWIDPSTSQGGQLSLPFFYPADCVDMTNVGEFANMGEIWLKSLVDLEHAQNASNAIRLTVYAWATEVELSSPTQTNFSGLAPQAGSDEMQSDGPVSKPASIVKKVAGALEAVPGIGRFAMATHMAAGITENIARSFGYCRPREISVDAPMKIWQTGDLAATDQKDTVNTLALTTKQEITLDPRTTGLSDVDEMSFDHLNSIHSYFAQTNWELGDSINTPLISIPVEPAISVVDTVTFPPSADAVTGTTTFMTSLPFTFWRGEMTYRFQVVGSGYHKGRLLAVWDSTVPNATPEVNTVYSKIIDISEERDFSITVGWGAPQPGLTVYPTMQSPLVDRFVVRGLSSPNLTYANGALTLYVLNDLVTSGANTSPVTILCHAYSKKMTYWSPDSERIKNSTTELQPAVVASEKKDEAPTAPKLKLRHEADTEVKHSDTNDVGNTDMADQDQPFHRLQVLMMSLRSI